LTMAEGLGHGGPHRLQHFVSRGAWDHDLVRDRVMALVAGELADVAVFSILTCPGVISGWFIGHDPEMKKFSSGKLILLATAEEAARRGTTRR
jgi:hypothetical protein